MDQAIIDLAYKYNGYGMALYVLITMLITGVISAVIGLERESHGQPAGLRTHVLLSVGCCLLMTISIWAIGLAEGSIDLSTGSSSNALNYDSSRIAAGIVAGVGFIGAGAIMKNGFNIRGLTTAATLWIVSAIGMAVGSGFILEGIVAGGVTIFFLVGLIYIEKWLDRSSPQVLMVVSKDVPILKEIHDKASKVQLTIKNIVTENGEDSEGKENLQVKVYFAYQSNLGAINEFVDSFADNPSVYQIRSSKFDKR